MYKRSDRLRELFQHEIAELLKDVKDPGLSGFLTVTGVDLSADAKNAVIFYSLLGSPGDRDSTQRALERSTGFMRQKLYAKLRLKYVPKLSFAFDSTPEHAHRIEVLLERIKNEGGTPVSGGGTPASGGGAQPPAETSPTGLDELASPKRRPATGRRPARSRRPGAAGPRVSGGRPVPRRRG